MANETEHQAEDRRSEFRLSRPFLIRLVGSLILASGALLTVLALVSSLAGWPVLVMRVASLLALLLVVGGGVLLLRRPVVVRFDEAGYQVRLVRGAGVKGARWKDVEDAVTARVSGLPCIVLRLRDGRATTLPSGILDASPQEFVAALRARLDRGHGYRRLDPSGLPEAAAGSSAPSKQTGDSRTPPHA